MRLFRLADLLAHKYKIAANEAEVRDAQIRRDLKYLWDLTNNKTYDVLRRITEAHVSGEPEDETEASAFHGQTFLKTIVSLIDFLVKNLQKVPVETIREKLNEVNELIETNASEASGGKGETVVSFPDAEAFIFMMDKATRGKNKSDDRHIKMQYAKLRTVLDKIHNSADNILDSIALLKGEDRIQDSDKKHRSNQKKRWTPRRGQIHEWDIKDFLRQHGATYGLNSEEDWRLAFENDPPFKEAITTVVNALNRGKIPRDGAWVKMEIARIMNEHFQRMATNAPAFEVGEDQFKEISRPKFVSPQLKKELLEKQRLQQEVKTEEWEKLQEQVRQRDEAHQRQQQELTEEEQQQEEARLQGKYSSRLEQIMKRYQ